MYVIGDDVADGLDLYIATDPTRSPAELEILIDQIQRAARRL